MINGGISSSRRSSSSTVNDVRTAVGRRFTRRVGGVGGTYVSALLIVAITLSCVAVHHQSEAFIVKRSFVRIGCMGQYDKAAFAMVDRICEECYTLYRELGLHPKCRSDCFKNEYFGGCVRALQLSDKQDEIDVLVNRLYGGSK